MGDTFLFSLGGTFLIIFHQYLYGWNFLILSWVAFSYGWHFHGALKKIIFATFIVRSVRIEVMLIETDEKEFTFY